MLSAGFSPPPRFVKRWQASNYDIVHDMHNGVPNEHARAGLEYLAGDPTLLAERTTVYRGAQHPVFASNGVCSVPHMMATTARVSRAWEEVDPGSLLGSWKPDPVVIEDWDVAGRVVLRAGEVTDGACWGFAYDRVILEIEVARGTPCIQMPEIGEREYVLPPGALTLLSSRDADREVCFELEVQMPMIISHVPIRVTPRVLSVSYEPLSWR